MRVRNVRIAKSPLIRAISTDPAVLDYMQYLALHIQRGMELGNKVSDRVRDETYGQVYQVGKELRPVVVVRAGFDTGKGRSRAGFFSVFLELGTRYMRRKTYMRTYARAAMKAEGLQVFKYKAYPKREGSVEWRK